MTRGKTSIIVGLVLLASVFFMVIFANFISPYDPLESQMEIRFSEISSTHIMGTDNFGRDIFTRILYGGRITLFFSFLAILCASCIGVLVGLISAFNYGKFIDTFAMRLVDVLLAMPFLVVAMAITTFFGRGLDKLLLIVVLTQWCEFARLSRSMSLTLYNTPSYQAAKVLGATNFMLITRQILPQIIFPMIINITASFSSIILSLSTISFFGLGNKPPSPEWGSMLADGRAYMGDFPHVIIFTCIFIFTTVISLNLISEGVRDLYSPYENVSLD